MNMQEMKRKLYADYVGLPESKVFYADGNMIIRGQESITLPDGQIIYKTLVAGMVISEKPLLGDKTELYSGEILIMAKGVYEDQSVNPSLGGLRIDQIYTQGLLNTAHEAWKLK